MSRNLKEYVRKFRDNEDDFRSLRIIEAVAGLNGENADTRQVVEWLKTHNVKNDSVVGRRCLEYYESHIEWEKWEVALVELAWLLALRSGVVGDEKNCRSDRFLKTVDSSAKQLGETLKNSQHQALDVPVLSLLDKQQQEEILLGQEVLEILRDQSLSRDERLSEIDRLLSPAPERDGDRDEDRENDEDKENKLIGKIQWNLVWEERYPLRMSGALERLRALVDERKKWGGRMGPRKWGRTELKKTVEKILEETYGEKAPSIAERISDLVNPPITRRPRKN